MISNINPAFAMGEATLNLFKATKHKQNQEGCQDERMTKNQIDTKNPFSYMNRSVKEAVISGNAEQAISGINMAIAAGIVPAEIIRMSLIAAMEVVGDRFKKGEFYVPEMLIAARAMKAGLHVLKPLMVGTDVKSLATVVIGTVKGDLHDIGKNLVSIMMEGARCTVVDLGVDIPPEKFTEAVIIHKPQILAMSALLTTTTPMMKETIAALEKSGQRSHDLW